MFLFGGGLGPGALGTCPIGPKVNPPLGLLIVYQFYLLLKEGKHYQPSSTSFGLIDRLKGIILLPAELIPLPEEANRSRR